MFCVLNEAEMNNVHYLFNNSYTCSVPCLYSLCISVTYLSLQSWQKLSNFENCS